MKSYKYMNISLLIMSDTGEKIKPAFRYQKNCT